MTTIQELIDETETEVHADAKWKRIRLQALKDAQKIFDEYYKDTESTISSLTKLANHNICLCDKCEPIKDMQKAKTILCPECSNHSPTAAQERGSAGISSPVGDAFISKKLVKDAIDSIFPFAELDEYRWTELINELKQKLGLEGEA